MNNRTRLPMPDCIGGFFTAQQMHAYSDAENAALRERLALHDVCNGRMAGEPPRYTPECAALRAETADQQKVIAAYEMCNPPWAQELRDKLTLAEQAAKWESDLCKQALEDHTMLREQVRVLREALALAYGHLWRINEEPGTPSPIYPAMQGAYVARKILSGLLTTDQRGGGIDAARKAAP